MIKYEYSGKKIKNQIGNIDVNVKEINFNGVWVNSNLRHIERHSPDGFQWGYGGSGPSDLALSILTHFCEKKDISLEIAEKYYQKFKHDFVAIAGDELNIKCEDISKWLIDKDLKLQEILLKNK